jgi:D-alanyl-D-alanine carboxypeptidase
MLSRLSGITFLLLLAITIEGWSQPAIDPATGYKGELINAYPKFLDRIENNELIWKDGTRMSIDDGKGGKSLELLLDEPDIKDMFAMKYPLGKKGIPPEINSDPGRVRYLPLFRKMYGDCRTDNFMANAGTVQWLPTKNGKNIKFTNINDASQKLQKVSDELDKLPDRFLQYLRPTQGTYNCRSIANSKRQSPHSFGIAIDIAAAHSDYWLWSKPNPNGRIAYKNAIPSEIIHVFEQYGFIWGGKWYHYDTMHFEYRPEIIAIAR